MKLSSSVWLHITFPLCTLILLKYFFDFPNLSTPIYFLQTFNSIFNTKNSPKSENVHTNRTSSVFCRGTNHTNRLCTFTNLCYEANKGAFVFFSGPKSVRSGIPVDRFSPALVDFSSVEDHNTMYFNYVELPLSAMEKFSYSFLGGHALILKRFHPENLMHVFHDDLIPIYATLRELQYSDMFLVLADDWPPGPYASLYENFLPKRPLYLQSMSKNHLHCFESIHIGQNKLSTWYQYGFKVPQGPLPKQREDITPVILSFRDYFLQRFVPNAVPGEEHAILFSRKNNRKVINEGKVVDVITEVSGLPTYVLSLDNNDVLQIISRLINCRIAVGMHGSLLILSLFLKPNSILIEIFPFGVQALDITPYRTLCWITDVTYVAWENTVEANTYPHPEYPSHLGGLGDLSKEESDLVKRSVVTPFLCCDNPVWLYRIYQDTVVDIDSFTISLVSGINGHHDFEEFQKYEDTLTVDKNSIKGHLNIKSIDKTEAETESRDSNRINKNIQSTNEIKGHSIPLINKNNNMQGTKKTESISSDKIDPSDIQNVSCILSGTSLTLEWDEPWNLGFASVQNVEYEVWIQEIDTEDVKAFTVKRKRLIVSVKSASYYAWVRCYADGRVGPFNSNPTICSES
ncbi:hypothetical protein JTE90_013816 [Oedothorax gibbosus]|uniref:Glycosyltransferase 61 catalytic domain-containing protein n=1 Tax=Oedothorax gibbosus TaxID=931172 RepID=A0AAV6VLA8_9ARAC|nr:hypothetical protein JTE90_013816 [Oedothorax gibbosus]